MMKLTSLSLVCSLVWLQSSCSPFQQQEHSPEVDRKEDSAKIPPPLHLGAVHQVIPERNFALLRIIGPMPQEGTVLISHPADGATDRVGNLIVSGGQHRRGNIIVADIRSGIVIQGDRVFQYRNISSDSEDSEPQTETADVQIDYGEEEYLPDFNSTPAVSDAGSTPFTPPPTTNHEPTPEPAPMPEPVRPPSETPAGIPDKLIDIPDTLDGWN